MALLKSPPSIYKFNLNFYRYDFNSDNFIQEEDVRIVLSYVPFVKDKDVNLDSMSSAFASY